MLKYIFRPDVFLDLQNSQGLMVGKMPQDIVDQLQDSYCDEEEKEDEIIRQEDNLKVAYDPAEFPQTYFSHLQHPRIILIYLKQ